MLRRLQRCVLEAITRAWADDLAMALPHGLAHIRALQDFFSDFASVSGLHLHIGKTFILPLWDFLEPEVRDQVQARAPLWGGVESQIMPNTWESSLVLAKGSAHGRAH